jgi:hypothetical protein
MRTSYPGHLKFLLARPTDRPSIHPSIHSSLAIWDLLNCPGHFKFSRDRPLQFILAIWDSGNCPGDFKFLHDRPLQSSKMRSPWSLLFVTQVTSTLYMTVHGLARWNLPGYPLQFFVTLRSIPFQTKPYITDHTILDPGKEINWSRKVARRDEGRIIRTQKTPFS